MIAGVEARENEGRENIRMLELRVFQYLLRVCKSFRNAQQRRVAIASEIQ